MFQDQLIDWRNEFSKWWANEFKTIKFPASGTIFSYFIDTETKKLLPWSEKVSRFELDMDIPLQVCKFSKKYQIFLIITGLKISKFLGNSSFHG